MGLGWSGGGVRFGDKVGLGWAGVGWVRSGVGLG